MTRATLCFQKSIFAVRWRMDLAETILTEVDHLGESSQDV